MVYILRWGFFSLIYTQKYYISIYYMAERFSAINEGYKLTDVELTNFEDIKTKIDDINLEYKTIE